MKKESNEFEKFVIGILRSSCESMCEEPQLLDDDQWRFYNQLIEASFKYLLSKRNIVHEETCSSTT